MLCSYLGGRGEEGGGRREEEGGGRREGGDNENRRWLQFEALARENAT